MQEETRARFLAGESEESPKHRCFECLRAAVRVGGKNIETFILARRTSGTRSVHGSCWSNFENVVVEIFVQLCSKICRSQHLQVTKDCKAGKRQERDRRPTSLHRQVERDEQQW